MILDKIINWISKNRILSLIIGILSIICFVIFYKYIFMALVWLVGFLIVAIPIICMIVLIAGTYYLPSIIAIFRKHSNLLPIIVINLVFGFSIVGWFISLIWSLTDNVVNIKD